MELKKFFRFGCYKHLAALRPGHGVRVDLLNDGEEQAAQT